MKQLGIGLVVLLLALGAADAFGFAGFIFVAVGLPLAYGFVKGLRS